MKLDLNENYCIVTDEYNFVLQQKFVIGSAKAVAKAPLEKNKGKIRYKDIGYYPNLKVLIANLLNREILLSEIDSFKGIENLIQECTTKIVDNISPYIQKEPKNDMGNIRLS